MTFQELSKNVDINFQGLSVDICSYHYTLRDMLLSFSIHHVMNHGMTRKCSDQKIFQRNTKFNCKLQKCL